MEHLPEVEQVLKWLGFVFSILSTIAINVIVTGRILAYVFGLTKEGGDYFKIQLPYLIRIGVTGDGVVAGFAAMIVLVSTIGGAFPSIAKTVVIENLQATSVVWEAHLWFGTANGVILSIILAAIKSIFLQIRQRRTRPRKETPSPEARVAALITED